MLFCAGRIVIVSACVGLGAVQLAAAADIPYPVKSPPPTNVPDSWTGFYLGGQIGYGMDSVGWRNLGASTTRAFVGVSLPLAVPGIVASAVLVFLYSLDEFTGTLLVGSPFVTTLPVYMYTASLGYELQIASVTAIVLMIPGAALLLLLERFLKTEYLVFFGQV